MRHHEEVFSVDGLLNSKIKILILHATLLFVYLDSTMCYS